jgi:hypothetical protein
MASADPLADARASTAAMYNSSLNYTSADASKPNGDVLAQSGNLAYVNLNMPKPWDSSQKTPTLVMLDGQGNQLTTVANPGDLATLSTDFGFDTTALPSLQSKLDSAGVPYKLNGWPYGFISTN